MLASSADKTPSVGAISTEVHLPATSLYELLDFILNQLPRWRDRSDRSVEMAEDRLTSQLCFHLNSATRHSDGWDILQFQTQVPDEYDRTRTVDMAPAPSNVIIWIGDRRHSDFDLLFPIECKILPTPAGSKRDEREYVISRHGSTGGIQRFKAGHHGAAHALAAMIAYVQEETRVYWSARIAQWITELAESGQLNWSTNDLLQLEHTDDALGITVFRSSHTRRAPLPTIELRHMWLSMN